MYSIMMYSGFAGAVIFFLLAVMLFIKNKVPSSLMYFVNMKKKGIDIWSANKKISGSKRKKLQKTEYLDISEPDHIEYEPTEFLDELEYSNATELLPDDYNEVL